MLLALQEEPHPNFLFSFFIFSALCLILTLTAEADKQAQVSWLPPPPPRPPPPPFVVLHHFNLVFVLSADSWTCWMNATSLSCLRVWGTKQRRVWPTPLKTLYGWVALDWLTLPLFLVSTLCGGFWFTVLYWSTPCVCVFWFIPSLSHAGKQLVQLFVVYYLFMIYFACQQPVCVFSGLFPLSVSVSCRQTVCVIVCGLLFVCDLLYLSTTSVCVCVRVRACVCACVRACVVCSVCTSQHSGKLYYWEQDSSVVRVPDLWLKGCRFESQQEQRENCLPQGQLSVLTLISVSIPTPCYHSSKSNIQVILPEVQVAGYS